MPTYNHPCKKCGSSNAVTDYGWYLHCYSCGTHTIKKGAHLSEGNTAPLEKREYGDLEGRGITKETAKTFGVYLERQIDTREVISFCSPIYDETGKEIATRKRHLKGSRPFSWVGDQTKKFFFGQNIALGKHNVLTITEGFEDAMAAYQMLSGRYPVVSIPDGAAGAVKVFKDNYEFLKTFQTIKLCFDADKPGQEAVKKVISSVFRNRVKDKTIKIVNLNPALKDANEYLKQGMVKEFFSQWYNASDYYPDNIISSESFKDIFLMEEVETPSIPYPWEGLNSFTGGQRKGELVAWLAPPKVGKCVGRDTPILMYDGTKKMSQNIVVGDILMGDDSYPRIVTNLVRGEDELFRIRQNRGEDYIVNSQHILTLRNTDTQKIFDINVMDFLRKSKWFQERSKGFKVGVNPHNWTDKELWIDPYILGLWLGDGHSESATITNFDPEIINAWRIYGESLGFTVNGKPSNGVFSFSKGNLKSFRKLLHRENLFGNKHIPLKYRTASLESRLKLLAGLLDSDGHLNCGFKCFEISQKTPQLAYDIIDLARSCGLYVSHTRPEKYCIYKGEKRKGFYYRIMISGEISIIPTKVKHKQAPSRKRFTNALNTGITIEPIGRGEYFGFSVVGNNERFLLGDYTVTHNSSVIKSLIYNVLMVTDESAGLLLLEERPNVFVKDLFSLYMKKPYRRATHAERVADKSHIDEFHEKYLANGRLKFLNQFGAVSPDQIVECIAEWHDLYGVKNFFFDHLTISVAGTELDQFHDERRLIDNFVTKLKQLTVDLGINIHVISHVNDDGKPRSSRAILQLADLVVYLERDKLEACPITRDTTTFIVTENRFTGETGPACKAFYDKRTTELREVTDEEIEELKNEKVNQYLKPKDDELKASFKEMDKKPLAEYEFDTSQYKVLDSSVIRDKDTGQLTNVSKSNDEDW